MAKRYSKFFKRPELILFVFAALWSFGGSIFLLAYPITIHEITAKSTANGSELVEEVTRQASWYEVQGWWGVVVLLIFTLLFISIALFAFRGQYVALAITSFLALALTYLSGLSVGPIYLPAAFAVLGGWLVIGLGSLIRSRRISAG